ncbi:MAG: DUF6428 family protein [Pseudomonadota bacterium]
MPKTPPTLRDLSDLMAVHDPAAPLRFKTEDGPMGPGTHITEFKHASIASIDCGGRTDAWSETVMQLLDRRTGVAMPVGRFRKIAAHSMARIPGLGDTPLVAEGAPGNGGMRRYHPKDLAQEGQAVVLHLAAARAACKPALASGCCG